MHLHRLRMSACGFQRDRLLRSEAPECPYRHLRSYPKGTFSLRIQIFLPWRRSIPLTSCQGIRILSSCSSQRSYKGVILLSSGISRWGHERSECTPVGLHPFVMHWKGWNLAVRTVLLAGAFLTALALTDTLARCSAFTFTTASTIVRPFRPGWGAFAISPRHPNHLLSQKRITRC